MASFSSCSSGRMFTTGLPRLVRLPEGTSKTRWVKTRPWLVKNSMWAWVLATNRCSTKSVSLVDMPLLPRPPRRWVRYSSSFTRLM